MNNIIEELNKHFQVEFPKRPTRRERLEGIQDDIRRFGPDLEQGWELISMVLSVWADNIPAHKLGVIEEEARALKVAVDEALRDEYLSQPVDEMTLAKDDKFA